MSSPCLSDTTCFHPDVDIDGALIIDPILSADVDNGFECRPDGIWVPPVTPRVSVLPASGDYDGQLRAFVPVIAAADGPVTWMMRWDVADACWYFAGGPPVACHVNTAESIVAGSMTWVGLATSGPAMTMPYPGHYTVTYGAQVNGAEAGTNTMVGIALDGVDPVAGHRTLEGSQDQYHSAMSSINVVVSGSLVIRMRYWRDGTATAATFQNRWINVVPSFVNP